jgi:DNA polymerase elongation subunit (family B)
MQYNISPETLIEPEDYSPEMRRVIMDGVSVEKLLDKKVDLTKTSGVTLTPNGQFFDTTKAGFLPTMLEEMYKDRKKFKKMMLTAEQEYENEKDPQAKYELSKKVARYNNLQLAKKVALNSAYGALGSQYFRFYDLRQALAVTLAGQLSIRWIENKLNEYMNTLLKTTGEDYVIASDTDSIYLRLGPLVNAVYADAAEKMPKEKVIQFMDKVCEQKIQVFIDQSFQELATYVHAYQQKMQMKREALADKGIWTAKKRYILNVHNNEGVQYAEPHLKVMGLEMVKSSTPQTVRVKMKELIGLIVSRNEEEVQEFIRNFREDFRKLDPEEVSFPRSVNGLKEYSDPVMLYKKGTPIHVKGAIHYNHQIEQKGLGKKYPKIKEGEKLKFCYLKTPNPIKDSVISYPTRLPSEFGLHKYVDYDMQFEKTFLEPVTAILDCIGWHPEKINSLDRFF